jgi:hypothetical protein
MLADVFAVLFGVVVIAAVAFCLFLGVLWLMLDCLPGRRKMRRCRQCGVQKSELEYSSTDTLCKSCENGSVSRDKRYKCVYCKAYKPKWQMGPDESACKVCIGKAERSKTFKPEVAAADLSPPVKPKIKSPIPPQSKGPESAWCPICDKRYKAANKDTCSVCASSAYCSQCQMYPKIKDKELCVRCTNMGKGDDLQWCGRCRTHKTREQFIDSGLEVCRACNSLELNKCTCWCCKKAKAPVHFKPEDLDKTTRVCHECFALQQQRYKSSTTDKVCDKCEKLLGQYAFADKEATTCLICHNKKPPIEEVTHEELVPGDRAEVFQTASDLALAISRYDWALADVASWPSKITIYLRDSGGWRIEWVRNVVISLEEDVEQE